MTITSRQCRNADGTPWRVSNFSNEAFGSLNITDATAHSVNTVYAQMVDRLGPKKVADLAQQIGGWDNLAPVCSIALGTSPVTPLQMAGAYAAFADGGDRPDALAVTKVVTPTGKVVYQQPVHKTHVLDANVANTVNQVLQSVLIKGTAAGKGIGRPAAGKTGTTSNFVDAWFVGYTPNLVAAVWMGFPPDAASGKTATMTNVHGIAVTGGTFPASIWQSFMKAAVAGTQVSSFPAPKIRGKLTGGAAPCSASRGSCAPSPVAPHTPACGTGGATGCPSPVDSPTPVPVIVPPSPSEPAPSPSPPPAPPPPSPSPASSPVGPPRPSPP